LPVGNGLADRNDEFVEWVFEDDGVLTQSDGLSTVVDGDVFPSARHVVPTARANRRS
jgi:hypothetical protein